MSKHLWSLYSITVNFDNVKCEASAELVSVCIK